MRCSGSITQSRGRGENPHDERLPAVPLAAEDCVDQRQAPLCRRGPSGLHSRDDRHHHERVSQYLFTAIAVESSLLSLTSSYLSLCFDVPGVRSIYSTIRFGSYEPLLDLLHSPRYSPGSSTPDLPPPSVKFASALLSGALGAIIANPTDLVKVTLQSSLPAPSASAVASATAPGPGPGPGPGAGAVALPYSTAWGGLRHIYRTEGVRRGLYRGGLFTTARAAVLTSAVIGSYDSIKNNFLKERCGMQDGNLLFVTCSMLAGVITTTAANPGEPLPEKQRVLLAGAECMC